MQKSWRIKRILLLLCLILGCGVGSTYAQYYSWGADASSLKWNKMSGERVDMLYPESASALSRRIMYYVSKVQGEVDYGFAHPALDLTYVIHSENFNSNALVMWMPRRVEFLTTPPSDNISMLWRKQLVAHEYRHAVQYNNLNQGVVKWLSYILGEQGSAVGMLFMPLYAMEGDAVMSESSMSSYGRALQPSFTIGYRAYGDEMLGGRNVDKWFCGSYKTHIPDHYELGYQIVNYSYNKYNENVWDNVVARAVRRPYLLFTTSSGLRKYYNTSIPELYSEAFENLNRVWIPISKVTDSSEIVSQIDSSNYTTYAYPMPIGGGKVLSLKSDFDSPMRFVIVDPQKHTEHKLAFIGTPSSRPAYAAGRVWWSEYRRSTLFDQRVNSQLCYMDLDNPKSRVLEGCRAAMFPTPIGESREKIAYVEYAPSGQYSVVVRDGDRVLERFEASAFDEIHGLAWDNSSRKLYVIVTSEDGMWIGRCQEGGVEPLHSGRYITISQLRAYDGRLYYGSIASGKDELWSYDLKSGDHTQITESRFGSFQPSVPSDDGYLYATTYNRWGYQLSRQRVDSVVGRKVVGSLPRNITNAKLYDLGLMNIDALKFESADTMSFTKENPSKRYRKATHLFNAHSWAPFDYNPFTLIQDQTPEVGIGATLVSQNLLSSCEAFISYGWSEEEGSIVRGALTYDGLGVELSAGASYGGNQEITAFVGQKLPSLERNYSVSLGVNLPLFFSGGYLSKQLDLGVGWNYSNELTVDLDNLQLTQDGEVANLEDLCFNEGLQKVVFSASYSVATARAHRDIASRWGYGMGAFYALNPTNNDYSSLFGSYVSVTTPAPFKHGTFKAILSYQTSIGGYRIDGYAPLNYDTSYVIPKGFTADDIVNENYIASYLRYRVPVFYPEGGVEGVAYVKRITAVLGFDAASFDVNENFNRCIYSWGGGVEVDVNFLRMPESGTTKLDLSIYKPENRSLFFQVGVALPF